MSTTEFRLTTLQLVNILRSIPATTKIFVSSSAQNYPSRFVGVVDDVLHVLTHKQQDEFPVLNCCHANSEGFNPLVILSVFIVSLSQIAASFDDCDEYCVDFDCNFCDSDDQIPVLPYLENPVGPHPPRRL